LKRIDFLLGRNSSTSVDGEPFTSRQVKIFINNKFQTGVVAMQTDMDLTHGNMRAYIKRWVSGDWAVRGDGYDADEQISLGSSQSHVVVDESGRFQYEELNPGMKTDALVVESIIDKGKHMEFYLVTKILRRK
jgi:hypothetical protein